MRVQFRRMFVTKRRTKTLLLTVLGLLLLSAVPVRGTFAMSDREQNIIAAGKLRVCIWPDYFSISYKNQKTGQLEGIDIDLSQELAKDLGVEVEYIPTHFGVIAADIQQDNCDIAMFGVGITEERAKHMDFSEPYLSSAIYAVVSRSNPVVDSWESMDQPGVIVCVQKSTYMEGVMRESLQHAELMAVIKNSQREIEVRSGRADVFITDYPYAQKMLKNYDWAQLLDPKPATEQFEYAYAIKQGQPEWRERVNGFVRAIKTDGRLKHYAQKNNLLPIALTAP